MSISPLRSITGSLSMTDNCDAFRLTSQIISLYSCPHHSKYNDIFFDSGFASWSECSYNSSFIHKYRIGISGKALIVLHPRSCTVGFLLKARIDNHKKAPPSTEKISAML